MDKAKLLDLMAEKGLTQAGLADKAGVSRTAVWGHDAERPHANTCNARQDCPCAWRACV